jgi:hypothetical protein
MAAPNTAPKKKCTPNPNQSTLGLFLFIFFNRTLESHFPRRDQRLGIVCTHLLRVIFLSLSFDLIYFAKSYFFLPSLAKPINLFILLNLFSQRHESPSKWDAQRAGHFVGVDSFVGDWFFRIPA